MIPFWVSFRARGRTYKRLMYMPTRHELDRLLQETDVQKVSQASVWLDQILRFLQTLILPKRARIEMFLYFLTLIEQNQRHQDADNSQHLIAHIMGGEGRYMTYLLCSLYVQLLRGEGFGELLFQEFKSISNYSGLISSEALNKNIGYVIEFIKENIRMQLSYINYSRMMIYTVWVLIPVEVFLAYVFAISTLRELKDVLNFRFITPNYFADQFFFFFSANPVQNTIKTAVIGAGLLILHNVLRQFVRYYRYAFDWLSLKMPYFGQQVWVEEYERVIFSIKLAKSVQLDYLNTVDLVTRQLTNEHIKAMWQDRVEHVDDEYDMRSIINMLFVDQLELMSLEHQTIEQHLEVVHDRHMYYRSLNHVFRTIFFILMILFIPIWGLYAYFEMVMYIV